MLRSSRWVILLTFALLGSGLALAQTPDGETPAEESVCDVLQEPGITSGLYGLCVAYCEAHDAEETSDAELTCNPSDEKILENYNRKKTDTDPEMPCLQPDCPCWDLDDVMKLIVEDSNGCWDYTCAEKAKYDSNGQLIDLRDSIVRYKKWYAQISEKRPTHFCKYRFEKTVRSVGKLTWDEVLVCHDLLHQAAGACLD